MIEYCIIERSVSLQMELIASITYIAALGIAAHYIGESLPRSWFNFKGFPFKPFFWERNGHIYKLLHVKRWKTKVPDMSRVMKDMLPKRVGRNATSESVERLIKETCVAETVHQLLCVLSLGVYFIWKNAVGVILSFICVLCNLPFIIIQRYNRPHLVALRDKLILREKRNKNEFSDSVVQYR